MHWVQRGHKKKTLFNRVVACTQTRKSFALRFKKKTNFFLFYNKQQFWFSISLLLMHLNDLSGPCFPFYTVWRSRTCDQFSAMFLYSVPLEPIESHTVKGHVMHFFARKLTWERSTDLKCGSALVTSSGCQAKIRLCFAAFFRSKVQHHKPQSKNKQTRHRRLNNHHDERCVAKDRFAMSTPPGFHVDHDSGRAWGRKPFSTHLGQTRWRKGNHFQENSKSKHWMYFCTFCINFRMKRVSLILILAQDFPKIHHVSTGDLLRQHVRQKTTLGKQAKEYMDSGRLVPDNLMVDLVMEDAHPYVEQGSSLLLDGFPRTIQQAKSLDSVVNVDMVINLEIPTETIVERLSDR